MRAGWMGRAMETRTLGRTGLRVPALSGGAAAIGGEYGPHDQGESIGTIRHGIEQGVTYWDTSPYYGRTRSEEIVGKALVGFRDKVVLSTKTGRYDVRGFDFSSKRIRAEYENSLKRLRTDHVDVLFAHDIEYGDADVVLGEALPTLAALKREGKVRFIGVSGYPLDVLQRASEAADLDVILSYSRYCLINTTLADHADRWRARGIGVVSASPLSLGLLTPSPPPWHPAPPELLEAAQRAVKHCADRGSDLAFLGMQFALRNPHVDTTLMGTAKIDELDANIRAASTPIDEELLAEVLDILAHFKDFTLPSNLDAWTS